MVQAISKWYLMMSMRYNDEYGSSDIAWYLIMSMRYNDEYGSSDIQAIIYNLYEI